MCCGHPSHYRDGRSEGGRLRARPWDVGVGQGQPRAGLPAGDEPHGLLTPRISRPRQRSTDDVLQHQSGLGTLHVSGLHEAYSLAVELRLLDPWLQTGPFHGLDAVVEGAVGHRDIESSVHHLCLVLRLPGKELLAVVLPDRGMCGHDDTGHRALHARLPGTLRAHDLPIFELLRVLPAVPYIPA